MADPRCTCPPEPEPEPNPLDAFSIPIPSGFTYHGPPCPLWQEAQFTPEVEAELRAKLREFDRARARAWVEAQTAFIG